MVRKVIFMYTQMEFLACTASHILEDKKTVMVGTGLPMIAAMLAQKTHAPNLTMIFEAGGVGPLPPVLPVSVGESRTFYKALQAGSMHSVMSNGQAGLIDYGFIGGAQIDVYGNLNSTVIGNWKNPKIRFPGSGGANDIGSWAWRTVIIMKQNKRKFVKELDFLTTPGYLTGPKAREKAGLPYGTGPYRVITQLAVYGFDDETKKMKLVSLHPGVTIDEIKENSSFDILIPEKIETTKEPTEKEIEILHKLDPQGIFLRK
ncbi:MAG TPA: 3-oxoacid CoA-transferase [Methanomicrobia archaeon]|nr:3-oxoacid CoA-transferase [Methanomicrobia archaeon]